MGPPDLIGCVQLGADAILDMVNTASVGNAGLGDAGVQGAGAAVTWLELIPTGGESQATADSSETCTTVKHRNPFDSLGEIAVKLTAKRSLPSSLEEYGLARKKEWGVVQCSRFIAEGGVLVSRDNTGRQ